MFFSKSVAETKRAYKLRHFNPLAAPLANKSLACERHIYVKLRSKKSTNTPTSASRIQPAISFEGQNDATNVIRGFLADETGATATLVYRLEIHNIL
jgi:hypothetical protein